MLPENERAAKGRCRSETINPKVFVGNLNYRTTKEELTEFLSEAGSIVDCFLPPNRETGKPRGFGFVTFSDPAEAKAAIEKFDGAELDGRRLKISEAEKRNPREGGGGGRGPRRDGGGGGGYRRGSGDGGGDFSAAPSGDDPGRWRGGDDRKGPGGGKKKSKRNNRRDLRNRKFHEDF